jgi:general stress protein 26
MSSTDNPQQHVHELARDIGTAMMVTRAADGGMHGRPMQTAQVDDAGHYWFATNRDSGKIDELVHDRQVCLTYCDSSGSSWVSITGTARIVDDRAKAKDLYTHMWDNWFDGPDDPELVLLCVHPDQAEYWDSASKAVTMIKMAAAAVTGDHYDVGENKKVDL